MLGSTTATPPGYSLELVANLLLGSVPKMTLGVQGVCLSRSSTVIAGVGGLHRTRPAAAAESHGMGGGNLDVGLGTRVHGP